MTADGSPSPPAPVRWIDALNLLVGLQPEVGRLAIGLEELFWAFGVCVCELHPSLENQHLPFVQRLWVQKQSSSRSSVSVSVSSSQPREPTFTISGNLV